MPTAIDPRSDAVVLKFHGDEGTPAPGAPNGTPPRDLTENDVARLAYERSLAKVTHIVGTIVEPEDGEPFTVERPDPRQPDPDVVEEILTELVATGKYAPPELRTKKAREEATAKATEEVVKADADAPDESGADAGKPEA